MSLIPKNDAEWMEIQNTLAQCRESNKGNPHPSQFKIPPAMAALPAQDAYGRIVDLPISESSPLIAVIPQALRDIAANLATQDNRCTADPVFLVREKVRITGMDIDYSDNYIWVNSANDWDEVTDPQEIERLEDLEFRRDILSEDEAAEFSDYVKTSYQDYWRPVQPFFTEAAAEAYIRCSSHRHHGELSIFVDWAGRNPEWKAVRNFLLSLNTAASSAPTIPSTTP